MTAARYIPQRGHIWTMSNGHCEMRELVFVADEVEKQQIFWQDVHPYAASLTLWDTTQWCFGRQWHWKVSGRLYDSAEGFWFCWFSQLLNFHPRFSFINARTSSSWICTNNISTSLISFLSVNGPLHPTIQNTQHCNTILQQIMNGFELNGFS